MVPEVLQELLYTRNITRTLIFLFLLDGGDTIKKRVSRWEKRFDPMPRAEGWQLSNAPILSMAAHKASLDIFTEAGFDKLTAKTKNLQVI